jgi:hypothetical protein
MNTNLQVLLPICERIHSITANVFFSSLQAKMMLQFMWANSNAVILPIPAEDPVIKAHLPERSFLTLHAGPWK